MATGQETSESTTVTIVTGTQGFTFEAKQLSAKSDWFKEALKRNAWRESHQKMLTLDDEPPVILGAFKSWLEAGGGCFSRVRPLDVQDAWATAEVTCEDCEETYRDVSEAFLVEFYCFAHRRSTKALKNAILNRIVNLCVARNSAVLSTESVFLLFDMLPDDDKLCAYAVAEKLYFGGYHLGLCVDDVPKAFASKLMQHAFYKDFERSESGNVGYNEVQEWYDCIGRTMNGFERTTDKVLHDCKAY